jgi:N-acyl-D-aspartate/D-glutamate deacylase
LSRIVFHGGMVFDGTGAPLADADVAIEDGRILEVAPGLDGDDGIDCSARPCCRGCSTHTCTWSPATRTSTRSG